MQAAVAIVRKREHDQRWKRWKIYRIFNTQTWVVRLGPLMIMAHF